jgi:PAS domain S-box-containing protein
MKLRTNMKIMEDQSLEKEKIDLSPLFLHVIEELPDGFCTLTLDGRFIYINQAARNSLGLSDDNYFQFNFLKDCITNKISAVHLRTELKKATGSLSMELELTRQPQIRFPAMITIKHIQDPLGNRSGLSLLIKDLTEYKSMQQQLVQAQKLESIGLLASSIAHEFNNILAGILPNAELIKRSIPDESPDFNRLSAIETSARRAAHIVKKLLSFARKDNSTVLIELDLGQSFSETMEIIARLFGDHIKIINKLPLNLYPIIADPTHIQQIIINLALNARDALNGSGEICFEAENIELNESQALELAVVKGQYVRFSVADSGCGIKPENLDKIFDPFFTTKAPGEGTGLGLSMVFGMMQNLKGAISVSSEINKGAQFNLYFPANGRQVQNLSEKAQNLNQPELSKTVLLVDDESLIREMGAELLNMIGFKVLLASGAEEALQIFQKDKSTIDLIIIDLIMPKINGLVCFQKIREIDNHVPVIISSGIGETKTKQTILNMGAAAFLEKPYSVTDLQNTIESIFN